MGIKDWIARNFGPEASLIRLQKDVERKRLKAQYAAEEIPLLEDKDKCLEIINKQRELKQKIRQKQVQRINPNGPKPNMGFLRLKDNPSEFKLKTPVDRVYKN